MDQKEMTAALASLITAAIANHLGPLLKAHWGDAAGVYFDGGDNGRFVDWGAEDEDGDLLVTTGDGTDTVVFRLSQAEFTRLAAGALVRCLDWS